MWLSKLNCPAQTGWGFMHVRLLLLFWPLSQAFSLVIPWERENCTRHDRPVWKPREESRRRKGHVSLPYLSCPPITSPGLCHGQFNEDCKIWKRFFMERERRETGFFVEIGGFNGETFSNSLLFEQCLGWQGLLMDAHPTSYLASRRNRPCSWNVWGAVCSPLAAEDHSFMIYDYIQQDFNATEVSIRNSNGNEPLRVKMVPCKALSSVFRERNITEVDFFSLDVEGSELDVLRSIDFTQVRIQVLLVEVSLLHRNASASPHWYDSNQRQREMHALLSSPPANMIRVPTRGRNVPLCQQNRKNLPARVFDLPLNTALWVDAKLRDDIC